jgi:hypothetical protein
MASTVARALASLTGATGKGASRIQTGAPPEPACRPRSASCRRARDS